MRFVPGVTVILLLGVAGCRPEREPALVWDDAGGVRAMRVSALRGMLAPTSIPGIQSAPWGESGDATFQLLELSVAERPHVHDDHDLTIIVLRGGGVLFVGRHRYAVHAGDVVYVGRGMPHHFHPDGGQPTVGLGIFVPHLDGKDTRIVSD